MIAAGMVRLAREPAVIARYEQALEPWAAGRMDYLISIELQMITGTRLAGWCQ